ncbi:MAG: type I-C CRISPR-associated protein Cas5c [Bacilli bacterium]|nr:type I-C CRISPR-associated protein Cas5c [Bacilli bacterium]
MGYGICLKIWGDYACFTRPEMKVERVSYDMITPSAARGIIEAIYWKPAIRWVIDKIHVINPIKFTNIRRNEVKDKIKINNILAIANGSDKPFYYDTTDSSNRQQRASVILKDVCYCIEAHFELTEKAGKDDDEKKHYNIALRRMREGQIHHQPVFGNREFPAYFELIDSPLKSQLNGKVDLGYMLYGMEFKKTNRENLYSNEADPVFYRVVMEDGIVDVSKCLKESKSL